MTQMCGTVDVSTLYVRSCRVFRFINLRICHGTFEISVELSSSKFGYIQKYFGNLALSSSGLVESGYSEIEGASDSNTLSSCHNL